MADQAPRALTCLDQEHHKWAISRSAQGLGQHTKGHAFKELLGNRRRMLQGRGKVKESIIKTHDPVPWGEAG